MLDERRDDQLVAVACGDVERRVPALVLAVDLSACTTTTTTYTHTQIRTHAQSMFSSRIIISAIFVLKNTTSKMEKNNSNKLQNASYFSPLFAAFI